MYKFISFKSSCGIVSCRDKYLYDKFHLPSSILIKNEIKDISKLHKSVPNILETSQALIFTQFKPVFVLYSNFYQQKSVQ